MLQNTKSYERGESYESKLKAEQTQSRYLEMWKDKEGKVMVTSGATRLDGCTYEATGYRDCN
jgi:hypothetical protein